MGVIEERDFLDIEEEIVNFGYDLLSFKFKTKDVEEGFLNLVYAKTAIKRIQKVILFGACSELNPKNKYTLPYKEATELINNCELAQTKAGSFIINIRIPLDDTYLKRDKEDKEEYIEELGRKTIKRIIYGLSEIKDMDVSEERKFLKQYKETINKNICDSFRDMLIKENSNISLDINAKWNPSKKIEKEVLSLININSKDFYKKFSKMSLYLKHVPEEKEIIISGRIKELKRQSEDQPEEKRLIKIYDDKLKRNIHCLLTDEEYQEICNLHRDKKTAQIKGILKQEGSRWFLDKANLIELSNIS